MRAMGFKDARLAALDALAVYQHDGNVIHAVAVGAFRRGSANAVAGVDAELMRLHMPPLRTLQCGAGVGQ